MYVWKFPRYFINEIEERMFSPADDPINIQSVVTDIMGDGNTVNSSSVEQDVDVAAL